MSFGKRAFFGYQVFDDGSGGWFVNLPRQEPMTLAETRRKPASTWLDELRAAFAADRTPRRGCWSAPTRPGCLSSARWRTCPPSRSGAGTGWC
jgi:hypothetical protein